MNAPDDLLLILYRAARELPVDRFQDYTLRLVKPVLKFQSAMWGAGRLTQPGVEVHKVHLHEVSQEDIAAWQALNPQDKVIPKVLSRPGCPMVFHSPTLFATREELPMREFTRSAGWQSSMVTALGNPREKVMQWVSLYRRNPDHLYADSERRFAEFLMPHLGEALTINHLLNLQTVYGESAEESGYLAYADMKGFIGYADPAFASLLTDEWPAWGGARLPAPLLAFVLSNRHASYIGKSIRLDAVVRDELLFLRARKLSKVDKLSPREIDVARRFGEGYSHKEIARLLGISPATVRHHLAAIYAKLGIHDKAQLAHAVR